MFNLWMLKETDGLLSEYGSLEKIPSFFGPAYLGVLEHSCFLLEFLTQDCYSHMTILRSGILFVTVIPIPFHLESE